MRTFKQFLIENEKALNWVKNKYKDLKTTHDALAQHRDASSVVDHFANTADPSPSKKYTEWITREYSKGSFRQEDSPHIKNLLTTKNQ